MRWPAQVARALLGVHDVFEPALYTYAPPQLPPKRKVRITGWWQSYRYPMAFEADIRRQFQLKSPSAAYGALLREIKGAGRTVSVHVRRGDYLTDRPGAVLPASYFHAAAEQLSPSSEPTTFFIFSDDLNWAMDSLKLPGNMAPVEINGGDTPEEELHLMAACRDHIIANSTFSWWGAWLNPDAAKQVIAPRQWLATPDSYFPDLLPPEWITSPVSKRDSRPSAFLK